MSPLEAALALRKPRWGIAHGMRVATGFERGGDPAQLALADCSFLPRTGLKGPGAADWLAASGVTVPAGANRWGRLHGGGLIGRLATSEFFIEDGPLGDTGARVAAALGHGAPGVYPVLRHDAALALVGRDAPEVLAQTCSFPFAGTAADELVMTSIAGVSALVIPQRYEDSPLYRIWIDPTFGPYLFRTLLEITEELGGGPLGLERLYPELQSTREP
jgi:sarcosine oxidase subunit gamma